MLVLDVRTPEELAETGYIKGAEHIDYKRSDFKQALATKLDKTQPVAVYCRSGGRSGETAAMLQEMGFSSIYDLDGGITAWMDAGMETVKE